MAKISIIVPIFNVEKYIKECIDSILRQSFYDYELILVDDGSTDSCPQICDAFAKQDKKIKVIHKPNEGLVSAWKKGLEFVKGEFVCFIDGDDFIDNDYLQTFINALQVDVDLVCMNCRRYFSNGRTEKYSINSLSEGAYVKDEYFLNNFLNDNGDSTKLIANSRWAKLIRSDIVKKAAGYCSTEVSVGEDYQLTLGVLLNCKKLIVLNDYKYIYRVNCNSIMNSYKPNLWDKTNILFNTIEQIPGVKQIKNYKTQLNSEFLLYVNNCIRNADSAGKLDKQFFNEVVLNERTQSALLNYCDSKMNKFDKMLVKSIRRKSYRKLKHLLSFYNFYHRLIGIK